MTAFPELSWRACTALPLAMAGTALVVWAIRLQFIRSRSLPIGPRRSLNLVRSFRGALVGAALVGVASGLFWEIQWLLVLSLIIGGEELLETSVMAAALRDEERRREAENDKSTVAVYAPAAACNQ